MRALKSLVVIVAALSLPSCTAYVHDHPARHPCHARPCERADHARPGERGAGIVGISIVRAGESHRSPISVERVLPGSPADDAEIRPGDRIRAIDGESTRGMTIPEAAHLIRGRAGTPVELRVDSPQGSRLVTLVRVPPPAIGDEGHHGHRHPCHQYERGEHVAPPQAAPPTDESLAPEVWPPTKPGHHAP